MNRRLIVITFLMLAAIIPSAAQKTYTNPVFRADFPDPSVQRGTDGYF